MSGWMNSDAGALPLEALRKSDTVRAAYSDEYDCAVAVARSVGGKERLLGAWTDALHKGETCIGDLLRTGVGVDFRSMQVWFS